MKNAADHCRELSALTEAELLLVRLCVRSTRYPVIRWLAIAASWLGNGWIYLAIGVLLWCVLGYEAIPTLVLACVSVGVCHCVYRPLKSLASRDRPFQASPGLQALTTPLDQHSFPSGHMMTLSAVLVSLPLKTTADVTACVLLWSVMSWARIAVGHHYLTDVLAGSGLAVLISCAIFHAWH